MTTHRVASFAALVSIFIAAPAAAQKIRVTTESVPVYVTVTDAQKRLVPGLTQEDFEILDNGKLQEITVFENRSTPITAVVMLDTSGSMTMNLDLV
jgi:VWFA-related protein